LHGACRHAGLLRAFLPLIARPGDVSSNAARQVCAACHGCVGVCPTPNCRHQAPERGQTCRHSARNDRAVEIACASTIVTCGLGCGAPGCPGLSTCLTRVGVLPGGQKEPAMQPATQGGLPLMGASGMPACAADSSRCGRWWGCTRGWWRRQRRGAASGSPPVPSSSASRCAGAAWNLRISCLESAANLPGACIEVALELCGTCMRPACHLLDTPHHAIQPGSRFRTAMPRPCQ
jgi:hypothetical protein